MCIWPHDCSGKQTISGVAKDINVVVRHALPLHRPISDNFSFV